MIERTSEQALALMDKSQWAEALKIWDAILSLEPGDAFGLNKKGVCQAELGFWDEAALSFQKALEIDPRMPEALSNLGNIALAQDDTDKAIAMYLEALKVNGDYAIAHKNLSVAYKKAGQVDKAVRSLKKAHALSAGATEPGYDAPHDAPKPGVSAFRGCLVWFLMLVVLSFFITKLR